LQVNRANRLLPVQAGVDVVIKKVGSALQVILPACIIFDDGFKINGAV
jgi:hypothetical protein